jgi:hypothetical protein
MHRCLSCNEECSISSIFCDACRLSLLERRAETDQEGQAEVVKAEQVDGKIDLMSLPRLEAAPVGAQLEATNTARMANEKHALSVETSRIYKVEMVEGMGKSVDVDEIDDKTADVQATNLLAVPSPARRPMPRHVRRALLVFCVVGVIALLTDGVLLALSIMRHHSSSPTHQGQSIALSPQASMSAPGGATPTSTRPGAASMALLLSSQRLMFTATQDQAAPPAQTVILSAGAQGAFSWQIVSAGMLPAWLHLSATQGSAAAGFTASVAVSVQPAKLAPGSYAASLLVRAFDTKGKTLVNSPQTLTVMLGVHVPCTVSVTPAKLSFAAVLLSAPAPQTLTLTAGGGCAFPLRWRISADAPWLTFSALFGSETGSGSSVVVQASSSGRLIGSYTAHITVQVTDSSSTAVAVSPATVIATLTVIG